MRPLATAPLVSLAAALLVSLAACGRDDGMCTTDCPDGGAPDAGPLDAALPPDAGPADLGGPRLVRVEVLPADPTLASTDGARPTQAFEAWGTDSAGVRRILPGVWSLSDVAVGTIDTATATFTASGIAGGVTHVRVEVTGPDGALVSAETSVTVTVSRHSVASGIPPASLATLASAPVDDASAALTLDYPLDGVLFPRNVAPPDVQWSGGATGELCRVRIDKPHVHVEGVVRNYGTGFGHDWLVDVDAWRALAESDPDDDAVVRVDRATGGRVVQSAALHLQFAHGVVAGAVYYWDLAAGHLLRIRSDARREDFMPAPPASPISLSRCIACHTVSRDGRYLAAEMWGAGSSVSGAAVYDLTTSLTSDPAPTRFSPSARDWQWASFAPDDRRLLVTDRGALEVIDTATGATVALTGSPLPTSATYPAWSPDGATIAYVAYTGASGVFGVSHGDIVAQSVAGDVLGAPVVLHHGADLAGGIPGGEADAFPSWSPDGTLIAFQHGPFSRSDETAPDVLGRSPGGLYALTVADGAVRRLDAAMGGPTGDDAFMPNFSPFSAGGHYWLAFFSYRDYGNAQAGTAGSARQQIWVTAIDEDTGAPDPSHVPYWLPGQDRATANMSAYWAPDPCRSYGEACSVSDECCSGSCRPDATSHTVCQPPPPVDCRRIGQTCDSDADCCDGAPCDSHVCGTLS